MAKAKEQAQSEAQMVKVYFKLKTKDGFPPVEVESVWANENADGTCVLQNVPFYALLVSWGDTVKVKKKQAERWYEKTAKHSGHSTIRVVLFDEKDAEKLRKGIKKLGCTYEGSNLPTYVAIDIPPESKLGPVQKFLAEGEEKGIWEYQESALAHPEE
jgi:Domain of unknown function (DUF4265)